MLSGAERRTRATYRLGELSMDPIVRRALALSVLCYGAALFLPGLAAHGPNPYGFEGYSGFACLVWGWTGALRGGAHLLPWTANLLYLPALVLWAMGPRARVFGVALAVGGIVLAALTYRIDAVVVNEAGHRASVRPGPGTWLWIASMASLPVAVVLSWASKVRGARQP